MAKDKFIINADLRDETGKGASRRLRHEGKIPAILYGDGKKSRSLTLDHDEIIHILENDSFYSQILSLIANGKKQRAIVRDIQRHAFKPKIMHMDFQRINSQNKLTINVPLRFINEEECIGHVAGGVVSRQINELEVICLPADLPEFIEIDIAALDIGDSIYLSEITLPENVESLTLMHEETSSQPVVSILHRVIEEEPEDEDALTDEEFATDEEGEETDSDDDTESSDE